MPSSDEILAGLTAISNQWRTAAIAWHVAATAAILALWRGWRPSNRVAASLLAAPLLSVSLAAWLSGNPFNGATFLMLFLGLLGIATRFHVTNVHVASPALWVPGALLTTFGWAYPHFLQPDHWTAYAYAAPLGLLPCPTLSAVIGATLMLGLHESRAWSLTLAGAALLYGVIGVFVLGVDLDYALIAGTLVLLSAAGAETFSAPWTRSLFDPKPDHAARHPG